MLPNTVSTMVSVSFFVRPVTRATSSTSAAFVRLSVSRHARAVRLRDLRHGTCQNLLVDLQRVWQPASSLMTGRPVTERDRRCLRPALEWSVETSISRSCPFHRGLEALRQVGSVAPAGGLERARRGQSAPGAPPRRPSESLRPHSALRPAGGRRPLCATKSLLRVRIPDRGGTSATARRPCTRLGAFRERIRALLDPHGQQRGGDGARRQWPLSTARL